MGESNKKRLVVVLGMHRSGTSAITRALELLGVRLGDNLHQASIDNPTGFWEDRDVLSINEEILSTLGYTYDRLGLIDREMLNDLATERISLKARDLVRHKCDIENTIWGFKDPRTARLLPFWQDVFRKVGCEASYIIVTRNPLSIVESLRSRDGFEPDKTFYLWLEHLIPAISKTMGAKRVVVDYDQLLENPDKEILRIARTLMLSSPEPLALAAYKNTFLKNGLRHTLFTTRNLSSYHSVPPQVTTCYAWLNKLAKDDVLLDSAEIAHAFDDLSQELSALSPALNFMARQECQLVAAKTWEVQVQSLSAMLEEMRMGNTWLKSQREAWEKIAAEREESIAALQNHVQDLLSGNAWLSSQREAWKKIAVEREESIAALQAHTQELLTGNAWLTSQCEAWENLATEREQSNAVMTFRLQETDKRLAASDAILNKIRNHWVMRFLNLLSKTKFL